MRRFSGQVLVEGVLLILLVIVPLTVLGTEIFRASTTHALFHAMSFHFAREVALGETEATARHSAWGLLPGAWPERLQRHLQRHSDFWVTGKARGMTGSIRYRYPSLLPYLHERFQVTKSCPFYF